MNKCRHCGHEGELEERGGLREQPYHVCKYCATHSSKSWNADISRLEASRMFHVLEKSLKCHIDKSTDRPEEIFKWKLE